MEPEPGAAAGVDGLPGDAEGLQASDESISVGGGVPLGGGCVPSAAYSSAACQVVALGAGDWRTALLRGRPVMVSVQLSSGPGECRRG
jgi:hypothetical protein